MRKYVQIVDLYRAGLQKPRFFWKFFKGFLKVFYNDVSQPQISMITTIDKYIYI